jgi:hypothetical protein
MIKLIVATIALTFFVVSTNAHEYARRGDTISAAEQWDTSLPAPFSRDQNDRFGQ